MKPWRSASAGDGAPAFESPHPGRESAPDAAAAGLRAASTPSGGPVRLGWGCETRGFHGISLDFRMNNRDLR